MTEIPPCWKLLIMVILVTGIPLINMYNSGVIIIKGMLDVVDMLHVIVTVGIEAIIPTCECKGVIK